MMCVRRIPKKSVWVAVIVIGVVLVTLTPMSFGADQTRTGGLVRVDYRDNALSVQATKAKLSTIFEEMARATAYEFIVPEEVLNKEATLGCSRVSIEEGVKRILAASGVDSHALVFDYRPGTDGKGVVRQIKVYPMGSSPRDVKGAVISGRGVTGYSVPGSGVSGSGGQPVGGGSVTGGTSQQGQGSVVPVPGSGGAAGETPQGQQGASEEVPVPGPASTEVPQPGPVSTDLPQPGPVSQDIPMPESSPSGSNK